jgi:hypothetical protein
MILFHVQTVLSFDTFSSYVKTKPILKLHCVRQTSIINPLAELLWYYTLSIPNNLADFEIIFNCKLNKLSKLCNIRFI